MARRLHGAATAAALCTRMLAMCLPAGRGRPGATWVLLRVNGGLGAEDVLMCLPTADSFGTVKEEDLPYPSQFKVCDVQNVLYGGDACRNWGHIPGRYLPAVGHAASTTSSGNVPARLSRPWLHPLARRTMRNKAANTHTLLGFCYTD